MHLPFLNKNYVQLKHFYGKDVIRHTKLCRNYVKLRHVAQKTHSCMLLFNRNCSKQYVIYTVCEQISNITFKYCVQIHRILKYLQNIKHLKFKYAPAKNV